MFEVVVLHQHTLLATMHLEGGPPSVGILQDQADIEWIHFLCGGVSNEKRERSTLPTGE